MATEFSGQSGYLQVPLGDTLRFLLHTTTDTLDRYEVFRFEDDGTPQKFGATKNMAALTITDSDASSSADNWYAPDVASTHHVITGTVGSGTWAYGDVGIIVAYQDSGGTVSVTQPFQVTRGAGIEYLKDTSPSDATAEATPNNLLGRLWTVEKNQRDVIMPRQKRILGLLGEHQVVDGFLYDDDGNITECRLRIFETKAQAEGVGIWQDRLNDVDPRIAESPVTGELAVYTISASNLLPRNLRTVFQQKIDAEESDNLFGTGETEGTTGSTI